MVTDHFHRNFAVYYTLYKQGEHTYKWKKMMNKRHKMINT